MSSSNIVCPITLLTLYCKPRHYTLRGSWFWNLELRIISWLLCQLFYRSWHVIVKLCMPNCIINTLLQTTALHFQRQSWTLYELCYCCSRLSSNFNCMITSFTRIASQLQYAATGGWIWTLELGITGWLLYLQCYHCCPYIKLCLFNYLLNKNCKPWALCS
jgi:hypothetical protein